MLPLTIFRFPGILLSSLFSATSNLKHNSLSLLYPKTQFIIYHPHHLPRHIALLLLSFFRKLPPAPQISNIIQTLQSGQAIM